MNKNKSIWAKLYESETDIMYDKALSDSILYEDTVDVCDFESALSDRLNTLQEEADLNADEYGEFKPDKKVPGMELLDSQKQKIYASIFKQVISCIKARQFDQAEQLRVHLYELNPNASKILFKTGQLIEAEKQKSKTVSVFAKTGDTVKHNNETGYAAVREDSAGMMGCWASFYQMLSKREMAKFLSITQKVDYAQDTRIIKQQYMNHKLYFINRGECVISKVIRGQKTHIKKIGSGDIAGFDSFINCGVENISYTALSGTEVIYIEKKDFEDLKNQYAELRQKMINFCQSRTNG